MRFSDYGLNLMSNGVVASDRIIAEHPDLVRRFATATIESIVAAVGNPEHGIDAFMQYAPNAGFRRKVVTEQWAEASKLLHTPRTRRSLTASWTTRIGRIRSIYRGIRQHAQRRGDARQRVHQRLPAAVSIIADCRAALFAVLLALAPATTARAQDYPSRRISVIVPAGPGAPPDTILRIVADPMSRALGQQIVVENVPGSGGITADRRAAGAAADGYTLLMASSGTHAGAPALYSNLGFDPVESFEQVGLIAFTYVLLVGRKQLPANDLRELIGYLKGK